MNKSERVIFERGLKAIFSEKQVKRGADYRKALVEMAVYTSGRIENRFSIILRTLSEIQQIFYSNERSPTLIFRLYNLTFLHAITMVDVFTETKSLSNRKLFGLYFHALVCHSPQQFRVMCLPSSNAEDEERMFNFLKTISTLTSNHHPDNVLSNAFIRMQVRGQYNDDRKATCKRKKHSIITKTGERLSPPVETTIPYNYIKKNPNIWQAHLERISDFLEVNRTWKESNDGIVFSDLKSHNLPMSHFRSSDIKSEHSRVQGIWNKLVSGNTKKIPADFSARQNYPKLGLCRVMYI